MCVEFGSILSVLPLFELPCEIQDRLFQPRPDRPLWFPPQLVLGARNVRFPSRRVVHHGGDKLDRTLGLTPRQGCDRPRGAQVSHDGEDLFGPGEDGASSTVPMLTGPSE